MGQNITNGTPMYKCMERVRKSDSKAVFLQQAVLVGSCTVGNGHNYRAHLSSTCQPKLEIELVQVFNEA